MDLSIIIPSRNRHQVLLETLRVMSDLWKEIQTNNVEIVIADNSDVCLSDADLDEFKSTFKNIVYANVQERIKISANFYNGFKLSRGEWIIFIGDDDFCLPGAFQVLDSNRIESFNAIVYNPHKYFWPSCNFDNAQVAGSAGSIILSKPWKDESISVEYEINRFIKNGGLALEKLPRAYHGLVRRNFFINSVKTSSTEFLIGSPDVSFSLFLSFNSPSVLSISEPLSIYGASEGSGGGQTTSGSHNSELSRATFLSADFVNNWNRIIPAYWSEFTVFPASVLYVDKQLKRNSRLDLCSVYTACLLNEWRFRKYVFASWKCLSLTEKAEVLLRLPLVFPRKISGVFLRRYVFKRRKGIKIGDAKNIIKVL